MAVIWAVGSADGAAVPAAEPLDPLLDRGASIHHDLAPFDDAALVDWVVASYLVRYKARTRQSYMAGLRRWLVWCARKNLAPLAVQRAYIEAWARELEEVNGLHPRTVNSYLTPVVGMYRWAHRDGLLIHDPGAYVEFRSCPRVSTTNSFTWEELALVVDLAANCDDPATDAYVHILAFNGCRNGETLDIDIEHLGRHGPWRTIHLPRRKGGGVTDISLSEPTQRAVDRAADGRTSGPLLVNSRTGGRLRRTAAARRLRCLIREAGLDDRKLTAHSFRHSFVTLALDAGVDIRDLMASTGHTDPSMIGYYDRARAAVERNATHAVTAWVQGGAGAVGGTTTLTAPRPVSL